MVADARFELASSGYEPDKETAPPTRNILSLLRSCLGPQTANWAILAGVFDITITFHYLLSPLRFYLWSDYTAHNPSILKCSLFYIVLTFKCDNQYIYCRLDDLGAEVGFEPTISYLMR